MIRTNECVKVFECRSTHRDGGGSDERRPPSLALDRGFDVRRYKTHHELSCRLPRLLGYRPEVIRAVECRALREETEEDDRRREAIVAVGGGRLDGIRFPYLQ